MADSPIDVVVAGGGIAGVSIGYELAAELRVLVLEAEPQLARHTTGRSAAAYLRSYGNSTVRALTAASRSDFDRLVNELGTPTLLSPRPLLWVADGESGDALPALLAAAGRSGGVVPLTPADACRRCPALRPDVLTAAALDESAMDIDVMALHAGYVRGLRRRGARVLPGAPLTALHADGAGWRVDTPNGSYTCGTVVDAAGAWADVVAERASVRPVKLLSLRRTLFTTPVSWPAPISDWPLVIDMLERFYFKPEGDQLLVSPADEFPMPPCDARPEDTDIALALEHVNAVTTLNLRTVRTSWAGLRSFVADRSPVVGARDDEPGFFWYAGQGGYGIQMAPALARAGAALLLGRSLPGDVAEAGVRPDLIGPGRLDAPSLGG